MIVTKVHTSAVVIIPPQSCWEPIQAIRTRHDRHVDRWMPHINLLYPFRPKIEFDALEAQFSHVCSVIYPIEIHLSNFNYFHHGHEHFTIWLEPEPRILLIKFQLTLLKLVPECNDVNKHKDGFTPHLSIGQVNGRGALKRMMSELSSSWNQMKFKMSEIYFISRENKKVSRFEIDKVISLNK